MFQNDGYFFGVFFGKTFIDFNTCIACQKSDIEMMRTGQAVFADNAPNSLS